jgi:hypothetical protein
MISALALALAAQSASSSSAQASEDKAPLPPEKVGVVSNVKVVSSGVPDVSSLEAWKASFIKPGMSDEEKAMAAWRTVASFQHQDSPPSEYLANEDTVCDAIKMFNVYGYGFCSMASAHVNTLARSVGLEGRGWGINAHSVPEVKWNGAWHLLDASLINYFKKPDGSVASVEDLIAATNEWYGKNPGFKGNGDKLVAFHREGGWQGWKKGPELLRSAPTADDTGWWPAKTHGWYATMQEYDGSGGGAGNKAFLYEYGYSQGYRLNLQLRPGERITRNWGNRGLHVNMKDGGAPGCLKMKTGQDSLVYTPKYGDLAPGRVGNGTHEWEVPLTKLRSVALEVDNLDDAARVKDPSKPATLVLRMASSYVYLGGVLRYTQVTGTGGSVAVSFSENNGLDWQHLTTKSSTVEAEVEIDVSDRVLRRYEQRVKFELKGAGTALKAVRFAYDIQHSQRALPAFGQGKNTVAFSAGPAEGTVTVEGSVNPKNKGKQLTYADFHPELAGMEPNLFVGGSGKGSIAFPVATPGDLLRLRFGAHYRARDARDGIDFEVSFDGGKSWSSAGRAPGGVAGHCHYVGFDAVPAGTRSALVRYAATSRNATGLLGFRIDADYREPAGGFRPVKVTYRWTENGKAMERVLVARKPSETWTIDCAAKPEMSAIVLELAD